jgi:large subunit ribosomal protein L9
MKVIFLQDVPNVAQTGQVKEVADGYARNYLIPRKLAALAQPQAVSQVETRTKKMEIRLITEIKELASQIEGKEVSLKAKAGAKDKLYGSITSADIATELKNAIGLEIDKRKIELEEPIRQLGSYEVTIKLGQDITPKIRVTVTEEEVKAEEKPPKKEKKTKTKAVTEKKTTRKEKKAPEKEAKEKKKTTRKVVKEPEAEKKTSKKTAKTTKAAEKKPAKKETKAKKEKKTG